MISGKKVVVVMPAYNAESTLKRTYDEIPHGVVDEVLAVDDASLDRTIEVCRSLGIDCIRHDRNMGYGANQKTCYREALSRGADIVVMLHPDYQYTPKLILPMTSMIAGGLYDIVLGSRILGVGALKGGMPLYKYIANRFLTLVENLLLDYKLAEYHTGYRAFSRRFLETIPIGANSDDFVFDNQLLAQAIYWGFDIGEITCPTKYFPEASSINFRRSVKYGFGVLATAVLFRLARWGIAKPRIFARGKE
jgi:glycosyltransferase involved in cell wall biosynthesis